MWNAKIDAGLAGIGIRIESPAAITFVTRRFVRRSEDNNVAEYAALLFLLQFALRSGCSRLKVWSDSEVMVRQISGRYECRSESLGLMHWMCARLIRQFELFELEHIRRIENGEANHLAQRHYR